MREKKQTQRAGRTRGFTAQQKFGPAISEAAEPPAGPCLVQSSYPIHLAGLRRGLAS
jgi:hypothetical protein